MVTGKTGRFWTTKPCSAVPAAALVAGSFTYPTELAAELGNNPKNGAAARTRGTAHDSIFARLSSTGPIWAR